MGSEDLPELELLAVTGKGAHEFSFSPCSLSLKDVLGEDLVFQGSELQGKKERKLT